MGWDGMGWDDVDAPTGWGYVKGRDSSVGGTQHPRSWPARLRDRVDRAVGVKDGRARDEGVIRRA